MTAAIRQPDGKLLIAGTFTLVQGLYRYGIARLMPDGSLDLDFAPNAREVNSMILQDDGKIIIGGAFTTLEPQMKGITVTRNRIARLNPDGSIDESFNPNANGLIKCMALQPDGKILLGGDFTTLQPNGAATATIRNYVARLLPDGSLDMGFNPNLSANWWMDKVNSMALQPDGKVILAGAFTGLQPNGAASATPRPFLARVLEDGSLDAGFNPKPSDTVLGVAVQPDGKVLLVGRFTSLQPNGAPSATARNRIARVAANGTLDTAFNPNANGDTYCVTTQADGKILVGGYLTALQPNGAASATVRNHIARLHADGSLDQAFNPNADNDVHSISVQPDGKILVGGAFLSLQPPGAASPVTRENFACLLNDPAIEDFYPIDAGTLTWQRSGSSPNIYRVGFELSTDYGSTWANLGPATQVGTTTGWQMTGLSLPASGWIRASARTVGGRFGGTDAPVLAQTNYSGYGSPSPKVDTISPTSGPPSGGTAVTITGRNFTGVTDVRIGGVAVSDPVVVNATTITGVTAANTPGAASVDVTTAPGGVNLPNQRFTYGPTVNGITPNLGRARGGTAVTIRGKNFDGLTGVTIGGVAARSVVLVDSQTITALTPPGLAGPAGVEITAAMGRSATNQLYTYGDPPAGTLQPLDVTFQDGTIHTTATQPDGKIIIAGAFSQVMGVSRLNLARLNADGSLDMGFDPRPNGIVRCVKVQEDGRILIGGGFSTLQPNGSATSTARSRIARLMDDGTLDAGFNPNANGEVYAIARQTDGKILIGGTFTTLRPFGTGTTFTRNRLARLNANGTVDADFNPGPHGQVNCILLQPDGKILVGGNFSQFGPTYITRPIFARLHPDGTLDDSFIPYYPANRVTKCIALQPDGKIIIGGDFFFLQKPGDTSVAVSRDGLARYFPDGTLDPSFTGGMINNTIQTLVLQADGKILIGGSFTAVHSSGGTQAVLRNRVARLDQNGMVDMAFDPNADNTVTCLELQADGSVLMGGLFNSLKPNGAHYAVPRAKLALLFNDPAPVTLEPADESTVLFSQAGSAPDVENVSIAHSSDQGSTWTELGAASRLGSTPDWELTEVSLPPSGKLRARGVKAAGSASVGGSLIEHVSTYNGYGLPKIRFAVRDTPYAVIENELPVIDYGTVAMGDSKSISIQLVSDGTSDLLNISASLVTGESGDYAITTSPPTSLSAGVTGSLTVKFEPQAQWARSTTLRIVSNASDEALYEFALTGSGSTAAAIMNEAFAVAGLSGQNAQPNAIPHGDGVPNLLKYAFNMDLTGPTSRLMAVDGVSGLPRGDLVKQGEQWYWRVQYIRQIGGGLNYTPRKSDSLEGGSFVPLTGTTFVQNVDEDWERVVIMEPCDPTGSSRLFTDVMVKLNP